MTGAGYWMTHLLLSDGDEDAKAQLLGAIAGSADPRLWSLQAHNARANATASALRAYAAKQVARPGEIHAVWDHSGRGLYPGDWPRTMRFLKANGVTDLFVNVAGAGFAHYPSHVLPQSRTFFAAGDQLAASLAAGHAAGVRVHAWVLCFTAERSEATYRTSFAKRGWRLRNAQGVQTDYLDPSNENLRWYLLQALDELVRSYPVDGVHLDFVRWYEGAAKPKNPAVVTAFVRSVRARVRAARPRAWLSAAVLPSYPSCVAAVGQDWETWLAAGLVDYVAPMDYTSSISKFRELLAQQASLSTRAKRTIIGIGVTANESKLNAKEVSQQVSLARQCGFAGQALFKLDANLETKVLPSVWR